MTIRIPVGGEYFDELRDNGCYYVDKTELLYELVHQTNNKVTLFTRPRRFGKTLMLSMIESFFDINRNSRNRFAGLSVMMHEDFCREWMNQYPVLFISFKDVEGLDFDSAYGMMKATLSRTLIKHKDALRNDEIDQTDREKYQRILAGTADLAEIKNSLDTLIRIMYTVYGKPVILLVDEYDVPLSKAHSNGYYLRMLDLIRGMLSTALKSNEYLKFGIITGCLRIARESIFTGVNNFKSYSVLDTIFSRFFGFTEREVNQLLSEAGLSDHMKSVRSWYDGYLFGNTKIFCPWDVVNYVSDASFVPEIRPKNYWKNTSSNDILLTFVNRTDFDVRYKFETLMNGGSIRQIISDELTYDSLHESEENLWSLLLMTGYLTKESSSEDNETASLRIPNEEILRIFEDTVIRFFKRKHSRSKQKDLMDALWNGNDEKASQIMTDILFETISYHDYHENYYHAFLTGIIYGAGYDVSSNQENGLGRTDITVREVEKQRGMIIEAKKSESEADMEKDCLAAGKQILAKQYLKGFSGFRSVICYGIAFWQKQALVRRLELTSGVR